MEDGLHRRSKGFPANRSDADLDWAFKCHALRQKAGANLFENCTLQSVKITKCVFIHNHICLTANGTYNDFLEVHSLSDNPINQRRFFRLQGKVKRDKKSLSMAFSEGEYKLERDGTRTNQETLKRAFLCTRTICTIYHPIFGNPWFVGES